MTLTFISPEWADKTMKIWKKYKAPVFMRKTNDPCKRFVFIRPGVSSIIAQLFIVNSCVMPDLRPGLRRKLLSVYTIDDKKKILAEVAKYDFICEIYEKEYESHSVKFCHSWW